MEFFSINGRSLYFNGRDAFCHIGSDDISDVECVNFAGETYSIKAGDDVEGPSVNVGDYMLHRDSTGVHIRNFEGNELFVVENVFCNNSGRILVDTTCGESNAFFWLEDDFLKYVGDDITVFSSAVSIFGVATYVTSWIFRDSSLGRYYRFDDNDNMLDDITHAVEPIAIVIYADDDYVISGEDDILHFYNLNTNQVESNLVFNDGSFVYASSAYDSSYIISGSFNAVKSISGDDFVSVIKYEPSTGS